MTDIVLKPITSGYNIVKINYNFDQIKYTINNDILHLVGGNNIMQQDLDMNGNAILNLQVDPDKPGSILTLGFADSRYLNVSGDAMEGTLDMDGNKLTGLPAATLPSDAVRKQELDDEISSRTSADENLQAQISGGAPLEASAFSPISWHDQTIDNSVVIPPNKNAWSFGPTMTISPGQTVTVSAGSFWTIADGELQ